MDRRIVTILFAALVGWTGRAQAVIGTVDDVPAATLLLPYFEIDQTNSNGVNTIVAISNASSAPVVAKVTVWSNLAVPVLGFDVYLTGYDRQVFTLRDVLVNGILPRTGPSDLLSPRGARSAPHNNFGGTCSTSPGQPPAYNSPAISGAFLAHLQAWLTGHPSALFGTCAATTTDHLVGFVTIDATNQCSLLFPNDPGYFVAGGQGVASNRNVLWGEWLLVDGATNTAQADTLVHIEASADDPRTSAAASYTFYGRLTGGTAADNRERLPARWNAPLDPLTDADGSAELVVWRDSGRSTSPFPCASPPSWHPLGSTDLSVLDANGASSALAPQSFPAATQRVPIAQSGSSLRLDLDTSTGSLFDPAKQASVIVLRSSSGRFDTGMEAVQEAGSGALGTADAAPGASLLLPYFEVDLQDPEGVRTALAVRNGSPSPVLARVVLWTDLSVPTFGFELYLPGFGSRIIDLRDLFVFGSLPASGPAPLPGCAGRLPPPPILGANLAALDAAHTGAPSQLVGGLCAGASHGDAVARGYVTVDVVNRCTNAFPGTAGYFGVGGAADYANVLWGDYALVEPAENLAHGDALVHLQASTTDPLTALSGRPTFYGRYVGLTAADHREALPSTWAVGSIRGGVFSGGAGLLVWRDTGVVHRAFACASSPASFPLGQGTSLHFDEMGQDVLVPPQAFSLEAQKRAVDWSGPTFGWLSLELGTTTGALAQPLLQSHVTSFERALGRFGVSVTGVQLPPPAPLFANGFEGGNTAAWALSVP